MAVGLAEKCGERFSYDSYRQFLDMFGDVIGSRLGMWEVNIHEEIDECLRRSLRATRRRKPRLKHSYKRYDDGICLDDYHSSDRTGRKEEGVTALDPRANNFDLMYEQVKAIKDGVTVEKPIYIHVTGLLVPPEVIKPPKILVIEGLHPIETWLNVGIVLKVSKLASKLENLILMLTLTHRSNMQM